MSLTCDDYEQARELDAAEDTRKKKQKTEAPKESITETPLVKEDSDSDSDSGPSMVEHLVNVIIDHQGLSYDKEPRQKLVDLVKSFMRERITRKWTATITRYKDDYKPRGGSWSETSTKTFESERLMNKEICSDLADYVNEDKAPKEHPEYYNKAGHIRKRYRYDPEAMEELATLEGEYIPCKYEWSCDVSYDIPEGGRDFPDETDCEESSSSDEEEEESKEAESAK